jgi:stage IV sporulation protein FB
MPLKSFLGPDVLFHRPFSTATWPLTLSYLYWINLILAMFNLIPAFPMDGGRVLRALLAQKLGYQRATKIAVNLGHIFALIFAYFGIIGYNIILIVIAIFIYMAASNEGLQVDLKETLKRFKVRDILSADFFTLNSDTPLSKVLELIFHSHQEDFTVVEGEKTVGFVTRYDIMSGMHQAGAQATVAEVMRKEFPTIADTDLLVRAQKLMEENSLRAIPVTREGKFVGVVTLEDIGRIYSIASQKA